MKPIVKWAGGKRPLLPMLLPLVPRKIDTYVEPFAGGAALFFALATGGDEELPDSPAPFRRAVLCDKNEDLVACYRAVRDRVEDLIVALRKFKYDRDLFYEVRAQDPRRLGDVARGARLLFLNRTCFNGLWRVNSKGQFNVPFGRYVNPVICDETRLRRASQMLAAVDVRLDDFETALAGLGKRDFVYFDPPYVPVSKTADFTAYAADKFGAEEQSRLRDAMLSLKKRGIKAMLSNNDTPESRALYSSLHIQAVRAPRRINRDSSKRGDVGELLVTTWPVQAEGNEVAPKSRRMTAVEP